MAIHNFIQKHDSGDNNFVTFDDDLDFISNILKNIEKLKLPPRENKPLQMIAGNETTTVRGNIRDELIVVTSLNICFYRIDSYYPALYGQNVFLILHYCTCSNIFVVINCSIIVTV